MWSAVQLEASPPPLQVQSRDLNSVHLTWTTNVASALVLEVSDSAANLPASWRAFPQNPILSGGVFSVTVGFTNARQFFRLHELPASDLPPDPGTVATPIPEGVASPFGESTRFLYTGPAPIQTGVTNGTITLTRAAVLRGKVQSRDNGGLPGVVVSVLAHPEFGQTKSRVDGTYDLAVNGGGKLTLEFEKVGFCPAQRQFNVPWQDFVNVPSVVMVALDPVVTSIALGTGSSLQVHQGSMQTDADGSRSATLLFPSGTEASLLLADGTPQAVGALHVRATEFTVGSNGPASMPATLPPLSAYTYCIELTADEALAVGATHVVFDRPLPFYVENFLHFPVGMPVPFGTYDRQTATWIPSPNGRVVKILSTSAGLAEVDTDGDGVADNGLGITSEERTRLAMIYPVGQTLWRVPVTHFSAQDANWAFAPPDDAIEPDQPAPQTDQVIDHCVSEEPVSSVIECQNQILGETIRLVGVPFGLNYRSDRVPGRLIDRLVQVQVSGSSVPASLSRIEVSLNVAGQVLSQTFQGQPNLSTTFLWDGRDGYGREILGHQPFTGTIGYVYAAHYSTPGAFVNAFGQFGGAVLSGNPARQEVTISQPISGAVGAVDARQFGLGGWTVGIHHFYDPVAHVLYTGDGRRRQAESIGRVVQSIHLDLTNAVQDVALGPDGSLYAAAPHGDHVYRLEPDGSLKIVAGNGIEGFSGDGGPATDAQIGDPYSLAIAPDGTIYLAERSNDRIRKVAPDGTISTVAGTGVAGSSGDGGPAVQAQLNGPLRVIVAPDGSLYINDENNQEIRQITQDGIITRVAGTGAPGFSGDGGAAVNAQLNSPFGIAVGPDQRLFIADFGNHRLRRVGLDGVIRTVIDYSSQAVRPLSLALAPDGSLLIGLVSDTAGKSGRVDRLRPDGTLVTIAGGGDSLTEQCPAAQAFFCYVPGLAIAPDGSIYVARSNCGVTGVARIQPPLPGFGETRFLVASEDGGQLYAFDLNGRHLQTLDALTGAVLFEFGYDNNGLLTQIIEKTGGTDNVSAIQRDSSGVPLIFKSPFGQSTSFTSDADGYLSKVVNPAGDAYQMSYTNGGLLEAFSNPVGAKSQYAYDGVGRLIYAQDGAGGTQDIGRNEGSGQFAITRTTALGRSTAYRVQSVAEDVQQLTVIQPDGTQSQSTEKIETGATHLALADGTTSDRTVGPDPRFGMQAPITTSLSQLLPSLLQLTVTNSRAANLSDPLDPLSISNQTDTVVFDGRTSSTTYDAATRTYTGVSSGGRVRTLTTDELGRTVVRQVNGLAPTRFGYDERGRLESIVRGAGIEARTNLLAYNSQGLVESITDPLGRVFHLAYDAAGRVSSQTLPDGRLILSEHDRAGNLTSYAPPGRSPYVIAYSPRGEVTNVTPPAVPGTGPTGYSFDADRALTSVSHPDGREVRLAYDSAGRAISRMLLSNGASTATSTQIYDSAGRVIQSSAGNGVTNGYGYDGSLLRSETWSGPVSGAVDRTYDTSFRLATQSVDGGNTVAFSYDTDGLLVGIDDLVITHDPQHGLSTGSSLGNIESSTRYNAFGELTNYWVTTGGTLIFQITLDRDRSGRIRQKTEIVQGVTNHFGYTYALGGQLIRVDQNGTEVESYDYDQNDNRSNANLSGVNEAALYDGVDRLVQYGSTSFSFNPAGQLLTRTAGQQLTHYQYDSLGNLLTVQLPGGTNVSYLVDMLDRRVGKKINGILVSGFLYGDALRPAAELDSSGNVVSRFVYAGQNVPAYLVKGGVKYRLITDQVHSVRLVVNSTSGAIIQRLDYDSFGNVLLDTNPGFQPFGFAGGLYDPLTGLVRFGRRDYDPSCGRWTTPDPLEFAGGSPNLYAYVQNRPIDSQDPKGLDDDQSNVSASVFAGVVVFNEGIHEGIGIVYTDGHVDRFDKRCGDPGMFGGFGLGCVVSGSADISKQQYPGLNVAFAGGEVTYSTLDPQATQNVDAWLEGQYEDQANGRYDIFFNSCRNLVNDALKAGGLSNGFF